MSPRTSASGQETTASSSPWASPTTGKPSPTERRSSLSRAWSRSTESTPAAASPPSPTSTSASLIRSSAEPRGEPRPPNPPLPRSPLRPADPQPLRADLQFPHPQVDRPFRTAPPTRPSALPAASMAAAVLARSSPELPRGAPCFRTGTLRQRVLPRASTRRETYVAKMLLCGSGWRPTT